MRHMRQRITAAMAMALAVGFTPALAGHEVAGSSAQAAVADTAQSADNGDNGLALTPPMGWNSWNSFGKQIDEGLIKQQADAMVSSGMKDVGYEYLVVDGGWRAATRDADGNMQVDLTKFPSGMKALADYVHSKGLKFGLHQPVGTTDCGGTTPGTQSAPGGEQQDADLFASWGVDFLKYDLCRYAYPPGATVEEQREITIAAFKRMATALENTGRPILYSISEYGRYQPWQWAPEFANMWRTTGDIYNCWDCTPPPSSKRSITQIIDMNAGLAGYAGPGGWNDPDMLMVGVTTLGGQNPLPGQTDGLTGDEARSHFSMWAIMAAPLIAGLDLSTMSEETRQILTNGQVIAVNQDPLGAQGRRIRDDGDQEVWVKPLADGSKAVVLFNRGDSSAQMTTTADEIGLTEGRAFKVRDLWEHKQRATRGSINATVPAHGVAMFTVSRLDAAPPVGAVRVSRMSLDFSAKVGASFKFSAVR